MVTGEAGVVRPAAHRHPYLGGHQHLVPAAAQDLAQDLLGQAAGVHVGGVDEVDPGVQAHVHLAAGAVAYQRFGTDDRAVDHTQVTDGRALADLGHRVVAPVQHRPVLDVRSAAHDDRPEIGAQHRPYQTEASASTRTSPTRVAVGAIHAPGLTSGSRPSKANSGTRL